MNERPTEIPEYIMAYALAMNSMAPAPVTSEVRATQDKIIFASPPASLLTEENKEA